MFPGLPASPGLYDWEANGEAAFWQGYQKALAERPKEPAPPPEPKAPSNAPAS